ncbi:hypothetical protein OF83DRAFT_1160145 [Amylostereum chailletii]|nr:hypothetical protein OF83DRAFT_1160145 [Amylostereum chailletii]
MSSSPGLPVCPTSRVNDRPPKFLFVRSTHRLTSTRLSLVVFIRSRARPTGPSLGFVYRPPQSHGYPFSPTILASSTTSTNIAPTSSPTRTKSASFPSP